MYFSVSRQRTTSYLWKKVSSIRLLFVSSVPATIVPNDPDRNFVARVKWLFSLDLIEKKNRCFTCKAKWISRLKLKVYSSFFLILMSLSMKKKNAISNAISNAVSKTLKIHNIWFRLHLIGIDSQSGFFIWVMWFVKCNKSFY